MSEIKHFSHIVRRAPRADVAILLITFLLTVFADLVVAVNIGVILAILQFLRRMAESVEVQVVATEDLKTELAAAGLQGIPSGVSIYEIDGPFFFGAVEKFEQVLMAIHADPKVVILRFRHVPFMDITGIQTLEEVIVKLRKRGVRTLLCEANERVRAKLWKAGVLALLGEQDFHQQFATALTSAVTGLAEGADGAAKANPAV